MLLARRRDGLRGVLMVLVNFMGSSLMNAASINNSSVFYNSSQAIGPGWTSTSQMILIALIVGAAVVIIGLIFAMLGKWV